jgi:opacity protein-like surface antigen
MKKMLLILVMLCGLVASAGAAEVPGVVIDKTVSVQNKVLNLNGYGIRKKFFIKVYIGALYATSRLATTEAALKDSGDKLIRMSFLHSRVEKEKIIDAFAEGFAANTPGIIDTADAKKFLALFRSDFLKGDTVDLFLGGDGTVTASHNGKQLGTLHAAALARAILAIYLGDHPADASLKTGMLGQ